MPLRSISESLQLFFFTNVVSLSVVRMLMRISSYRLMHWHDVPIYGQTITNICVCLGWEMASDRTFHFHKQHTLHVDTQSIQPASMRCGMCKNKKKNVIDVTRDRTLTQHTHMSATTVNPTAENARSDMFIIAVFIFIFDTDVGSKINVMALNGCPLTDRIYGLNGR